MATVTESGTCDPGIFPALSRDATPPGAPTDAAGTALAAEAAAAVAAEAAADAAA